MGTDVGAREVGLCVGDSVGSGVGAGVSSHWVQSIDNDR